MSSNRLTKSKELTEIFKAPKVEDVREESLSASVWNWEDKTDKDGKKFRLGTVNHNTVDKDHTDFPSPRPDLEKLSLTKLLLRRLN